MKIVINRCYGGFGLSPEAILKYTELKGIEYNDFIGSERNDPILVQLVEEMGSKSCANFSKLKIVEIPDDVEWQIAEYDGSEWVEEKHRTWR